MTVNLQGERKVKLDFLIEPGKFRHKGVFNLLNQIKDENTPPGRDYTETIQDQLPVWFSFKEASGLMLSGEELDLEYEDNRPLHKAEQVIVFRFNKKLSDWFFRRKASRLIYEKRQYPLISLVNYNGINVYHFAVVGYIAEQKIFNEFTKHR